VSLATTTGVSIGAIVMPVNALTKADKLAFVLRDARACALLTHGSRRWPPAPACTQSSLATIRT